MTEATVINESCQQTAWSGGVSFYPTIDTFAKLKTQLDEWARFTLSDLDAIGCLQVLPTSTFSNGVLTCRYSLNRKEGLAYGWGRYFGQTGNGPTSTAGFGATGKCALIVPGSGLNQADAIIANTGYQNILYNPVCTIGDGIVHVLPGCDFRLLAGTNGKGYLRDAINNYLLDHGSSLALLEIIEACALLKWMQVAYSLNPAWPLYTKRAVLGLSDGAYHAMIAGLLMSPDAAVCASGISLATKAQGYGLAGNNVIPGIYGRFDQAQIVSGIQNSPAKWLFSKSTVDDIAILLHENATGYTQSLLNFSNVTHTTHSTGHKYPPNLGTWLASALA